MKKSFNWIVRKDNEIIEYLKGTKESVELYIEKLQKEDFDSEYCAEGFEYEFNDNIKFKELR